MFVIDVPNGKKILFYKIVQRQFDSDTIRLMAVMPFAEADAEGEEQEIED